jgi:hypothetical protein
VTGDFLRCDWRLPTVAELKEIYEIKKSNTDKDGDIIHIDPIFSSGGTFWNWSSEEQGKCCAKVFLFIAVSVYRVLQMRGGGYADVLPVLQVPDNKADAVPCKRLQIF